MLEGLQIIEDTATSALCLVTGYNSGQGGIEIEGQQERSGYNHRSRPATTGMKRQENISSKGAASFTAKRGSLGEHKIGAAERMGDPRGNKECRSLLYASVSISWGPQGLLQLGKTFSCRKITHWAGPELQRSVTFSVTLLCPQAGDLGEIWRVL